MTKKEKRDIVVNLKGYVNPQSKLLIIGFEESAEGDRGENSSEEDFIKLSNGYTNDITLDILKKIKGT